MRAVRSARRISSGSDWREADERALAVSLPVIGIFDAG
jgi:hypothetical protein